MHAKLVSLLPTSGWLIPHDLAWLRSDLIAGVTLAAYAIPVALAYAALAGLTPQMGLYCYLFGGLGYALLGSSRHLAIGPTSAISLLLGVSLVDLSGGDLQRQAALASFTALLMAGVYFLAWLLRLSVLVNFISQSILVGFKAGAALVIAATQLPKLFGVRGGGDDFFERIWLLIQQLHSTNGVELVIGSVALGLLLGGEKLLPGRPVALAVVLLSLVAVALGRLERYGITIVGEIPAGLPRFGLEISEFSALRLPEMRQLVRLSCACFLLSYIESISAARTFALKHRYDISPRQELLGLGAASFLAGLFQGYPIAGGLSQSAVNERSGAKTALSLIVASAAIACVLLFLTGLFRTLPDAVLAAVVLVAVRSLIDIRELRHLWRVSRLDFSAAAVALALERHREDALDRADRAVEGEFAHAGVGRQLLRRELSAGDQETEADRQVERGGVFGEVRRREVDDDAVRRPRVAAVDEGTLDAVRAFFDGGFGQANEDRFRHGGRGDVDFHVDRTRVDAVQRVGQQLGKHGPSRHVA